jgi:hypothetical protein
MSQVHIRMLLGQMDLDCADLDMLAVQLTAALDGPLLLPVRVRPHRRPEGRRTDRPQLAGPDTAHVPALTSKPQARGARRRVAAGIPVSGR